MTTAAISIRGLTKRFGAITAVDRLDLTVAPGEVLGFVGPNGAGKTTTIRTLMGFLRPTSGSTEILGRPAADDPALRRQIGYLPGDLRIDPGVSADRIVNWFGRLRGGVDRARVDELVERLGVETSRPFGALSKGNRQKVGIVQALCHRPRVLILDEPTTGLDPLVQREFLNLLLEAAADGAAVLMSSHVLPEVERIASRVAVIKHGRLVTIAGVDDLLDRARTRIELRYAEPVAAERFTGVPGVSDISADDATVAVTVDGPVGPLLHVATDLNVPLLRVRQTGDELEDMLVAMYEPQNLTEGASS